MYVDTLLSPQEPLSKDVTNAVVIVIDVLRATSTIITALANGCEEVIATAGIEESLIIASSYSRQDYILGGEQRGEKVEGFSYGNSPSDYTAEAVNSKRLILSTTNGTRAIKNYGNSKEVMVGCFLNADAVIGECIKRNTDVYLVCSGQDGRFTMEDALFAGLVAKELREKANATLSDSSRAAVAIYEASSEDLFEALKSTDHGSYLVSIGYEHDVKDCSHISKYGILGKVCDKKAVRKEVIQ